MAPAKIIVKRLTVFTGSCFLLLLLEAYAIDLTANLDG